MKQIFTILIAAIAVSACGGPSTVKDETTSSEKIGSVEAPQWFEPNKLEENDIEIEEKQAAGPVIEADSPVSAESVNKAMEEPAENRIVSGFRVQIAAAKAVEKMKQSQIEAKYVFNPKGYEVYLVYESPLYKIRVGDALTRQSAEKLLNLAKENGYRDSWIVPDMVNSALDKSNEE